MNAHAIEGYDPAAEEARLKQLGGQVLADVSLAMERVHRAGAALDGSRSECEGCHAQRWHRPVEFTAKRELEAIYLKLRGLLDRLDGHYFP